MAVERVYVTDLVDADQVVALRASSIPLERERASALHDDLASDTALGLRPVQPGDFTLGLTPAQWEIVPVGGGSARPSAQWSPQFIVEALQQEDGPDVDDLVHEMFESGRVGFEASQARMRRLVTVALAGALIGGGASPLVLLVFATGIVVVELVAPIAAGLRSGVEEGVKAATSKHAEDVTDQVWRRLRGLPAEGEEK